jgi:hypothetical protein
MKRPVLLAHPFAQILLEIAKASRGIQILLRLTTPPTTMAGVVAVLRHAMTGSMGEVYSDNGHASIVLGDLYMREHDGLIDIAQKFLRMIAHTIEQLSGAG